jgi:hypothetical protein
VAAVAARAGWHTLGAKASSAAGPPAQGDATRWPSAACRRQELKRIKGGSVGAGESGGGEAGGVAARWRVARRRGRAGFTCPPPSSSIFRRGCFRGPFARRQAGVLFGRHQIPTPLFFYLEHDDFSRNKFRKMIAPILNSGSKSNTEINLEKL